MKKRKQNVKTNAKRRKTKGLEKQKKRRKKGQTEATGRKIDPGSPSLSLPLADKETEADKDRLTD